MISDGRVGSCPLMISPVVPNIPRLPKAKWLAIVGLLVWSWWGIPKAISLPMHPASAQDDFFYVAGWNLEEPMICREIDPYAIGRRDQQDDNLTYMQSDCYRNVAVLLHEPEFCNQVRSAGLDRLVGSIFTKWKCRKQNYTVGTSMPDDQQSFVQTMRAIGYGDEEVLNALYQVNPINNTTHEAFEKVQNDPAFVQRINSGSSYAESFSAQSVRPAYSLEYLYEMMAVERNDSSLCRKISPNAAFQARNRPTISMLSGCYWDLAFNLRDESICNELPLSGTSPIVPDYNSREACVQNVAVLRRPSSNLNRATSASVFFSKPTQFQEALEQIGYASDLAHVPRATDEDYWRFFSYLEGTHDQSPARNEFVNRVIGMNIRVLIGRQ